MTEPDPTDLPAVASKLITTIGELTRAIQMLMDRADAAEARLKATEDLAKSNTNRTKRNERKAHTIRILVAADIMFTLVGSVLVYYLVHTNFRIDAVCPYAAFDIGTYAPLSRAAGPARDQYVASFDKMRAEFIDLDCGSAYPIVPGAAHPPVASPPG
jgi:hypothetical protein